MAVLTFILLIISVCTIVMSFCMTYTVSSARNSKGDFYKYDRLLKYVEPLSYAAVLISIVFGVLVSLRKHYLQSADLKYLSLCLF